MDAPVRVRILGVGMGPSQVTCEVAGALRSVDYVLAADKADPTGDEDPLLGLRRAVVEAFPGPGGPAEVIAITDPPRDRSARLSARQYESAVADWHTARAHRYADVLRRRGGTAAFLVWGDPSLYDSTIRIVEHVRSLGVALDYDVLPGVSAPALLAARHRMVLHQVGRSVHVTTGRHLQEAVAAGLDNIVAMLNPPPQRLDFTGLDDWTMWWGANLGAPGEQLLSGRAGDVVPRLADARAAATDIDGWVMDLFLVRRT
ncbi:MAG: precorrin-6A synthase (deacetylating) [Mycobacterium kyogaense]|uniref:precorrin-6A synthase (deacetylating) n=1 Tax=Mycobacterium kyogaense TaxID=2212479 RepID=UPI002FF44965